jgi:hypothetical protein
LTKKNPGWFVRNEHTLNNVSSVRGRQVPLVEVRQTG